MKVKVITSTDNKNLNIEFTKILFDIALQNIKNKKECIKNVKTI